MVRRPQFFYSVSASSPLTVPFLSVTSSILSAIVPQSAVHVSLGSYTPASGACHTPPPAPPAEGNMDSTLRIPGGRGAPAPRPGSPLPHPTPRNPTQSHHQDGYKKDHVYTFLRGSVENPRPQAPRASPPEDCHAPPSTRNPTRTRPDLTPRNRKPDPRLRQDQGKEQETGHSRGGGSGGRPPPRNGARRTVTRPVCQSRDRRVPHVPVLPHFPETSQQYI